MGAGVAEAPASSHLGQLCKLGVMSWLATEVGVLRLGAGSLESTSLDSKPDPAIF